MQLFQYDKKFNQKGMNNKAICEQQSIRPQNGAIPKRV
ncbi:hypothetical protein SynSYN20_00857 [Synechococcus sp. SYN20]|nr:hypothetical protein SynSYN20_00857 [Synechococcus sp. SYN20]